MTRQLRVVGPLALLVLLTGCGAPSSDEVVADLASAWGEEDVDAFIDLTYAEQIGAEQRAAITDAMSACALEEDSEVDVPGVVSHQARVWAFAVDCSGTRSLVAGNFYNTAEDDGWTIDPGDLPGGDNADVVPSVLPADLRELPKAGV